MYRIYEVRNGDTLENVASRLGITPEVLASLNGLNQNATLSPNSYIVVPGTTTNMSFDRYTVQKGDNMYQIANAYNVSPSELLKLNGLNENDIIYPGQEILVPRPTTGFYVTENEDTISEVANNLNIPIEDLLRQNRTIYLMPDQLIVYRK